MAYIKFKNSEKIKSIAIKTYGSHIARIEGEEPNVSGFRLYLDKEKKFPLDKGEYEAFTTLYRQGEGWYELSNDGSVYQEPEEQEPVELTEEELAALERRQQIAILKAQIDSLKRQLESSDYQIIKMYEYSILGKQTEYDIEILHQNRQAIRDAINEKEEALAKLEE